MTKLHWEKNELESSWKFNINRKKLFLFLFCKNDQMNRQQQPTAAFRAKAISRIWCHRKWRMNN